MSSSPLTGGRRKPTDIRAGPDAPACTLLIDVTMPQMGVSVAEGTVVEWKKQPGDWVERDEIIASISTDKIDTDVEAPASGRVQEILVEVGTTVDVGVVMARIATDAKPGEPHASESASGGTSEADVAMEAPGEAGELSGDTTDDPCRHRPARDAGGSALRPAPLLAGGHADRRRARHRPREGRGHRPRRPRAQARRARVPRGQRRGEGRAADAHREPVQARADRAEAGGGGGRPARASRSRACASRSAGR